jgi:hypothetical protein
MIMYLVRDCDLYHVAIKIRKVKYIVVFGGNYKQFVYLVNHNIGW